MNKIKHINPEAFIKCINETQNGNFGYIDSKDFEIEYEKIHPLKGFEIPVNEKSNKKFPHCCKRHSDINNQLIKWYAKFPNCCPLHKKLNNTTWFKKQNYSEAVEKILMQLAYSEHCIETNIDKADWYEAITEYFEWNIFSFGQFPDGFGSPLGLDKYITYTTYYLQNRQPYFEKRKIDSLINYFTDFMKVNEKKSISDLNKLKATYYKWLKIFPFNIPFFKEQQAKKYFSRTLPFISGKIQVNRYTKVAKGKLHSEKSLVESLNNLTANLLQMIDYAELLQQGKIANLQATKLEFANAALKTKTSEITNQYTAGELKYVSSLKKWLEAHKEYFQEITPLLKDISISQDAIEIENNFDDVEPQKAYDYFRESLVLKNYLSEEDFNSFWQLAFVSLEKPTTIFTLKNVPTKARIRKLFYHYFKTLASSPRGKKEKYVNLLSDYFMGFEHKTTFDNFNK